MRRQHGRRPQKGGQKQAAVHQPSECVKAAQEYKQNSLLYLVIEGRGMEYRPVGQTSYSAPVRPQLPREMRRLVMPSMIHLRPQSDRYVPQFDSQTNQTWWELIPFPRNEDDYDEFDDIEEEAWELFHEENELREVRAQKWRAKVCGA